MSSFAEQGKQTSVFLFCLQQINGSLPLLFSVCSKQIKMLFSVSSVFRVCVSVCVCFGGCVFFGVCVGVSATVSVSASVCGCRRWALFSRFCARECEAKKRARKREEKKVQKSESTECESKKRKFALFPPATIEIQFQSPKPLGRGKQGS